ncbi:RNA methyltransferase [Edaphobacter sp. 12200R-103]|jgi:TrmH family RNA methyltransferase|uniref:TrmH family RNA methyltransferase n=1 Tax=Edaphobacter sp. 12200R-103 TaxID=2703788 RepID=UPI00138D34B3|nr:RNA methyltransferase [Edaphobacter sp. 12200R-103]QHS51556.1 RNA methyltransferase [Edaphobacter sp. 12200R-103]
MAGSEEIKSRSNARVKQLRAAFAGQERLSEGLLAIEGEHLLEEAVRSGLEIRTVFLTEHQQIPDGVKATTEIVRLSTDVFRSAVETRSPQGIAALVAPAKFEIAEIFERQDQALIVIAAGLQDPGNLGTIIRSAEAFGANGVIATPGTVSVWNQKAVRASVGSVFRLPVATAATQEIADLAAEYGVRLLAAMGSAKGGVLRAQDISLSEPCAFLIGNEGAGLSQEWMKLGAESITIPCPGPVESLNAAVAASLLLYEASRQRSLETRRGAPRIPGPLRRRPTGATR